MHAFFLPSFLPQISSPITNQGQHPPPNPTPRRTQKEQEALRSSHQLLLLAHPPDASHDANMSDGGQSWTMNTPSYQKGLPEVTELDQETGPGLVSGPNHSGSEETSFIHSTNTSSGFAQSQGPCQGWRGRDPTLKSPLSSRETNPRPSPAPEEGRFNSVAQSATASTLRGHLGQQGWRGGEAV